MWRFEDKTERAHTTLRSYCAHEPNIKALETINYCAHEPNINALETINGSEVGAKNAGQGVQRQSESGGRQRYLIAVTNCCHELVAAATSVRV